MEIPYYLKWLSFYLDFCEKYSHPVSSRESLPLFTAKLEQKNQAEKQIEQAHKAITLFYKLIQSYKKTIPQAPAKIKDSRPTYEKVQIPNVPRNQSWKKEFDALKNEIMLRQYSRKTLSAYTRWTQIFQAFLKSKAPDLVDSKDAGSG
jgi:hypothetical protein